MNHGMWTRLLSLALAGLGATGLAQVSQPETDLDPDQRVLILFDRSGSMRDDLDGVPKIDIARGFFEDLGGQIEGRRNVSVRFFAAGEADRGSSENCESGQVALPFGQVASRPDLDAMAASVTAVGQATNIDHALRAARSDLQAAGGGRILLISDGLETCEGDPAALAQTMGDMPVDVIAMGDGADLAPLADIALNSGGAFHLADSPGAFAAAAGASLPGSSVPEIPDMPPPADPLVESIAVDTGVESCPAFDVVRQNVIALERGSVALTSETVEVDPELPVAAEFILDASGSMAGQAGGEVKMTVAMAAFESAVAELAGTQTVSALRAYGFDSSLEWTEEASCPNTELLTAFAAETQGMVTAARGLTPYGYTPIAASLEAAAADLTEVEARERLIILITDGEETCGGDPVAVAASLAARGVELSTHVVGFDLEPAQAEQMRAVAEAGGGRYLDAPDAASLTETLREVVGVTVRRSEREMEPCINPLTGGQTVADAVPIDPGLYTMGELLPEGEYRYYRVATEPGELATVRALLQSYRYIDENGTPVESTRGSAAMSVQILTPEGDRAGSDWPRASGMPGETAVAYYAATDDRGFVIGVGDNYDRVPPESLLSLSVEPVFDGAGGDAPAEAGAGEPTISVGETVRGHVGYDDVADVWRVAATGPLTLSFTPEDVEMRYRLDVSSEEGRRLDRETATGPAEVSVESPGVVLVRIESREPSLAPRFTAYELSAR